MLATLTNGVSSTRIAEILRSARDLMNNNGKHWVKGTEKVDLGFVNADTREEDPYGGTETGQYAYCSIGSIREVTETQDEYIAACLELIKSIDPARVEEAVEEIKEDYECDCLDNQERIDPNWQPSVGEIANYLMFEDMIADNNDDQSTTWKDVRGWFTSAAARAARRKG